MHIEAMDGRLSDRAPPYSSKVFRTHKLMLSEGETGMDGGNHRGQARADSNGIDMCTPHANTGSLSSEHKKFNGQSVPRRD